MRIGFQELNSPRSVYLLCNSNIAWPGARTGMSCGINHNKFPGNALALKLYAGKDEGRN